MEKGNIRNKTISGVLWGFIEKFSIQAFGFIQGVILARLLSPSDYGLIAMVGIFMMLAYALIDSGFGTALIQKKNRTEKDYSTVFLVNVGMSSLISLILFLCSSLIADFYHEPILQKIVSVYALLIFLTSFVTIQDVRLSIHLEFRKKSIINVITTVVSGLFAIALAFMDFGVWSLVYPLFLTLLLKYILYWYYQHWIPKLQFSKKSFKALFGFGSKILASSILATIFENLYSIIIGRAFSAKDLGYYSRSDGYANLPTKTITGVVESVAYPVLSELQDDDEALLSSFRRMLRTSAFIIFPIMIWLATLAKPLIVVLVTEKWLPCVIYLQILCLDRMWWHVHVLNLSLLKAKGRSDLFFKLEVIKKILTIVILILTVPMGIVYMCIGSVVGAILSMIINSYYTGRLMSFGIIKQFRDMLPSILYAFSTGAVIFFATIWTENQFIRLGFGTCLGAIFFFTVAYLTRSRELRYIVEIIKNRTSAITKHE